MAIYNTPDGRQVVGSTVAGNDYHGFNGKRDIIIQLTADGATTDGLNALEYLKAYAVEQNKQNKPIFPNGTRVFISANGYTKAVEADDIVIDGDNITIGGIKWDGSAWDYSEAGQTGGGGGGGVLVVHMDYESGVLDKTWREIDAADVAVIVFSGIEGGETFHVREFVNNTSEYDGDYFVNALVEGGGGSSYIVVDPDDYPVRQ